MGIGRLRRGKFPSSVTTGVARFEMSGTPWGAIQNDPSLTCSESMKEEGIDAQGVPTVDDTPKVFGGGNDQCDREGFEGGPENGAEVCEGGRLQCEAATPAAA